MNARSGIPPIPPEDIQRLLANSEPTISRYVASIYLGGNWVSSGIYAKCFGYEGILTAGHCAMEFLAAEYFGLMVSESPHQLWVNPKACDHVPIGYDEIEGPTLDGPDLSFVIIHNRKLLSVIHSQKREFYDLDNNKVKAVFDSPVAKFNWSVAGVPSETVRLTRHLMNCQEYTMVNTTIAVMQGNLVHIDTRHGFDYIKLHLLSDFEGFPTGYDGVSGAGIWYHRLVANDENSFKVEPILAGIVCWQSELTTKRGYKVRSITGHGYDSIYGHVPEVLAQKRAGP